MTLVYFNLACEISQHSLNGLTPHFVQLLQNY